MSPLMDKAWDFPETVACAVTAESGFGKVIKKTMSAGLRPS